MSSIDSGDCNRRRREEPPCPALPLRGGFEGRESDILVRGCGSRSSSGFSPGNMLSNKGNSKRGAAGREVGGLQAGGATDGEAAEEMSVRAFPSADDVVDTVEFGWDDDRPLTGRRAKAEKKQKAKPGTYGKYRRRRRRRRRQLRTGVRHSHRLKRSS